MNYEQKFIFLMKLIEHQSNGAAAIDKPRKYWIRIAQPIIHYLLNIKILPKISHSFMLLIAN